MFHVTFVGLVFWYSFLFFFTCQVGVWFVVIYFIISDYFCPNYFLIICCLQQPNSC